MRILVVDDERSYGSLLSSALKKLGHRPVIAVHPEDALAMLREAPVDAVITDIDMPVMSGVELAERIRAENVDLPIAFCTGSNAREVDLSRAAELGQVLPKVWTVVDVRRIVDDFDVQRRRFASGSSPSAVFDIDDSDSVVGPAPAPTELPPPPPRDQPSKLKVLCRTWQHVRRLCDEQAAGRTHITARGGHPYRRGERVVVSLSLPDELTLSVAALVVSSIDEPGGRYATTIAMVGLTAEVCGRLRDLSAPHV